jgi:hypothetical protein
MQPLQDCDWRQQQRDLPRPAKPSAGAIMSPMCFFIYLRPASMGFELIWMQLSSKASINILRVPAKPGFRGSGLRSLEHFTRRK